MEDVIGQDVNFEYYYIEIYTSNSPQGLSKSSSD